jgi:hypothetical protein
MVERGIVKFFDDRDGKHFGFLTVLNNGGNPTGHDMFFHYNDGGFIGNDGVNPIFEGIYKWVAGKIYRLRTPQIGEIIVFSRAPGRKGDKACPWGFAEEWDTTIKWLNSRPIIRVVRTRRDWYKSPPSPPEVSVIWEGKNIFELSAKFHRQEIHPHDTTTTQVADDLKPVFLEAGHIDTRYNYEVMTHGRWIPCPDPRVMLCCVPATIYREFSRYGRCGLAQDVCHHK